MVNPVISQRRADPAHVQALVDSGLHPLMARLWAARGLSEVSQIREGWPALIPPARLLHAQAAARLLADAIEQRQSLLIVADYDCDGATACALGLRALRAMGAQVDFLVPNRFETGYGLSPAVIDLILQRPESRPDMLITVDNGIASLEGVAAARKAGMGVIVTDHHLPGDTLPDALAIVNPNQPSCSFPSKNLAGVGVIFYLMLALRAELRERGTIAPKGGPRLDHLADLLALGTVADVVRLDANNRLLVTQGLRRIRQGQMHVGVRALFAMAGRDARSATAQDLGFFLGPRINAAGRLADMSLGIRCLSTDDEREAMDLARRLEDINIERRALEGTMREQAMESVQAEAQAASVCIYREDWHQGVIGLVASRLKETYWRPALAFAPSGPGEIKGSGRSIPDVHLRDVLDLVSKRLPGAILKFGGHAMAAGLTLRTEAYPDFVGHFDSAVQTLSGRTHFEPLIETDGSLEDGYANAEVAGELQAQVWGAGFPAPTFRDTFRVIHQRLLKDKHLKLYLERGTQRFDAIWFNHCDTLPEFVDVVYRLEQNVWNGRVSVQLLVEHAVAA
ncbi:MAG: single-stranded-DNA-specific exonuclease RecJ [Alcaligenaceae bacterium]|nr:single-stranded-DNA-specific exonuclease RecJ [Alcaligenaceae bacterium]